VGKKTGSARKDQGHKKKQKEMGSRKKKPVEKNVPTRGPKENVGRSKKLQLAALERKGAEKGKTSADDPRILRSRGRKSPPQKGGEGPRRPFQQRNPAGELDT